MRLNPIDQRQKKVIQLESLLNAEIPVSGVAVLFLWFTAVRFYSCRCWPGTAFAGVVSLCSDYTFVSTAKIWLAAFIACPGRFAALFDSSALSGIACLSGSLHDSTGCFYFLLNISENIYRIVAGS
jgi:hypothetical protein